MHKNLLTLNLKAKKNNDKTEKRIWINLYFNNSLAESTYPVHKRFLDKSKIKRINSDIRYSSQIKELSFVYNLIQINLILNTNKSKIKYILLRLGIDKTRIILK